MGTPAPAGQAADPALLAAFGLGWHVAELYAAQLGAAKPRYPPLPADLPGLGDLKDWEKVELSVRQVRAALGLLAPACAASTLPLPSLPDALAGHSDGAHAEELRADVHAFHLEILLTLTAVDFRLGKAYGLGRALADTTLLPTPSEPKTLTDAFDPFRILTLTDWLDDLKTALPQSAAVATSRSLQAWAEWVAHPTIDGEPVTISDGGEDLTRALRSQGRLWRSLLSGEKRASDLLSFGDYLMAARGLIDHTSRLARGFLRSYKWAVAGVILAGAAALALSFVFLKGSSQVATVVLTFLGWIGLSWKSVSGSLGKAVARVEPYLWNTELEEAIASAAVKLPTRWPEPVRGG